MARACDHLLEGLAAKGALPLTLLSQYLPRVYDGVRAGAVPGDVRSILREGVAHVLRDYAQACHPAAAPQGGTDIEFHREMA